MKTLLQSLIFFVVMIVLVGLLYPLGMTVTSQAMLPRLANGSILSKGNEVIGSELIGQQFNGEKYFHGRPSASNYSPLASGSTNLSITSAELQKAINERKLKGDMNEMLFSSGSGLDPHISPSSAYEQIGRIAKERKFSENQKMKLKQLVVGSIERRQWGILGEPRVNVLKLNLALDAMVSLEGKKD